MKKVSVTHIELQNMLGDSLREVLREDMTPEDKEVVLEKAKVVLNFSNQMINNGNFILNSEKHLAQIDDLSESVIKELIGSYNAN